MMELSLLMRNCAKGIGLGMADVLSGSPEVSPSTFSVTSDVTIHPGVLWALASMLGC